MAFSAFDQKPGREWTSWHPAYSGEVEGDVKIIGRILNTSDSEAIGFAWGKEVAGRDAGPLHGALQTGRDIRISLQVTRGNAPNAPVLFDQTIRVVGRVFIDSILGTGTFLWNENTARFKTRICDGFRVARVIEAFDGPPDPAPPNGRGVPEPPFFRHESASTIEVEMPSLPEGAVSLALWSSPAQNGPYTVVQDGLEAGQILVVDFIARGGQAQKSESLWFRSEALADGQGAGSGVFSARVRDSFAEWEGNTLLRGYKGHEWCIGDLGFKEVASPNIERMAFGNDAFDSQPLPLNVHADLAVGFRVGYKCALDEGSVFHIKRDDIPGRGSNRIKYRFSYLRGESRSSLAVDPVTGETWYLYRGEGGVRLHRSKNGWGGSPYFTPKTAPLWMSAPETGQPAFTGGNGLLLPDSDEAPLALQKPAAPAIPNDFLLFGAESGAGATRTRAHFGRTPLAWHLVSPFSGTKSAPLAGGADGGGHQIPFQNQWGVAACFSPQAQDGLGGLWLFSSANRIAADAPDAVPHQTFFRSMLLSPHFSFVTLCSCADLGTLVLLGRALRDTLPVPLPGWQELGDKEKNLVSWHTFGVAFSRTAAEALPESASSPFVPLAPTPAAGDMENGFLKFAALPATAQAHKIAEGDSVILRVGGDAAQGARLTFVARAKKLNGNSELPLLAKASDALVWSDNFLSLYQSGEGGLQLLRSYDGGATFF